MANYKPTAQFHGHSITIPAGAVPKFLSEEPNGTLSLHHRGANYQVTAGKKFIATHITLLNNNTTGTARADLWESTTVDTADGTEVISNFNQGVSTNVVIPCHIEFAASKFVTVVNTSAFTFCVAGYEVDA